MECVDNVGKAQLGSRVEKLLLLDLVRVVVHGAELEAGELAAAHRFTAVGEEERPAIFDKDRQHQQRIHRQREQQENEREFGGVVPHQVTV